MIKNMLKNHLYIKNLFHCRISFLKYSLQIKENIGSLLLRLCFNIAFWSLTRRCLFCWHMTCPLLQAFFLLTQKLILIVFEGWVSMTLGLFEWLTTDLTRLKLLLSSHICVVIFFFPLSELKLIELIKFILKIILNFHKISRDFYPLIVCDT